jgi:hypothetical protein
VRGTLARARALGGACCLAPPRPQPWRHCTSPLFSYYAPPVSRVVHPPRTLVHLPALCSPEYEIERAHAHAHAHAQAHTLVTQLCLAARPAGPCRVWVKRQAIPGLAMSRSIGDKLAGAAAIASFLAGVWAEIYLCNVCSCQEILRRNGRGQARSVSAPTRSSTTSRYSPPRTSS